MAQSAAQLEEARVAARVAELRAAVEAQIVAETEAIRANIKPELEAQFNRSVQAYNDYVAASDQRKGELAEEMNAAQRELDSYNASQVVAEEVQG